MDVYGIIYVLENTVNKKKYVGQTTRSYKERYAFGGKNNAERMYKYHKYHKEHNLSYNKHLLASFEKYGYENFTVCERFDIAYTKEELDDKERYYIKKFNSFENGYNKTTGGTSDYEVTDTVKILNYDIKNIDERLEIINLFLGKVEEYNYEIDSDLLEKISNYILRLFLKIN